MADKKQLQRMIQEQLKGLNSQNEDERQPAFRKLQSVLTNQDIEASSELIWWIAYDLNAVGLGEEPLYASAQVRQIWSDRRNWVEKNLLPLVLMALHHSDRDLRDQALEALTETGQDDWIIREVIHMALDDPDPELRGWAIDVLNHPYRRAVKSIPHLLIILDQAMPNVQARIVEVVKTNGYVEHQDILREWLSRRSNTSLSQIE
jgi:hypothetical protein